MSDFKVEIQNLDKLASAMENYPSIAEPILQKAIEGTQFVFEKNTLKDNPIPWRTGNLLQSFRFRAGRLQARWFPTAHYAQFVQFGTRPHVIMPKNGRVLSWATGGGGSYQTAASGRQYYKSGGGGQRFFAMKVNHPGTKPRPFMEKIVEKSEPEVARLFEQAGDMITRAIASQI